MKKRYFLFLLTFITLFTNLTAQWEDITPDIPTGTLRDFTRIDDLTVLVIGDEGFASFLYKSGYEFVEDTIYSLETNKDLTSCYHTTDGKIFIGSNDVIFNSKNNGETWTEQFLDSVQSLTQIQFRNMADGFFSSSSGKWGSTSDGGESWVFTKISEKKISSFVLLPNSKIIAVGDSGVMLKSTDDGLNWEQITSPTTENITSINIDYEGKGFITSKNVYKTENFGETFQKVEWLPKAEDYYINVCPFVTGYDAVQSSGQTYWFFFDDTSAITDYVSDNKGLVKAKNLGLSTTDYWMCGNDEFLAGYKHGLPYQKMEIGTESLFLHDITSFNPDTSILIGKRLYYTKDGGESWDWNSLPWKNETGRSTLVSFKNFNQGVLALGWMIGITGDRGKNWEVFGFKSSPADIHYSQSGKIYLLYSDILLTSTNSGNDWNELTVDSTESPSLLKLEVINDNNILIYSGFHNKVYQSTDAGTSWRSYDFNAPVAVSFADTLNGLLASHNEIAGPQYFDTEIYRTSDGGNSWELKLSLSNKLLYGMMLSEDGQGFVSVRGANLYHSSDFGENWELDSEQPGVYFQKITTDFNGAVIGLSKDSNSVHINHNYNIIITELTDKNFEKPLNFELGSNYPNPFNPTTRIPFSLPSAGNVIFELYDIQGQLISRNVNYYKSGTYESEINGIGLASGVYFLKVSFDSEALGIKIQTLKLVLTK